VFILRVRWVDDTGMPFYVVLGPINPVFRNLSVHCVQPFDVQFWPLNVFKIVLYNHSWTSEVVCFR
jgi:hypothetical protein